MADANFEAQRMAELMAQVNYELERLGHVTKKTQEEITDAEMKSKYGIENFTKGTQKGAEAVTALASAAGAAGKAMLEGKKGASAFNDSVDQMATAATAAAGALALFVPVLGPLMLAIGAATLAYSKYTKAANEQADKLYKGYQGLAKSGAAASDGMTGLFKDAKKLGLSMNELDSLVGLIGENSRDLALFSGSVAEGRKRFADMGAAMEPHRQSLIRMGMLPEQINEGMAGYLRTQTRLGNAQRMTTDQLAQGAREYLKEQDALTKLTGQAREETEKKREAALMEEQFAAKIRQLQLSGQTEAAERLIKLNDLASASSEELGRGLRAAATGNLVNADAQKFFMSTQGKGMRDIQDVIAGTKAPEAALQSMAKTIGETNDKMGVQLGVFNAANNFLIGVGEARKIQLASEQDFVKQKAKIEADQLALIQGQGDKVLNNQAELIDKQIAANNAMESFINKGIGPAQKQMMVLADATKSAAEALDELTPGGRKATASTAENVGQGVGAVGAGVAGGLKGAAVGAALGTAVPIIGNAVGAVLGGLIGSALGVWAGGSVGKEIGAGVSSLANMPKAADGGLLTGPKSGYMAMLHGTELVIPEDMLKGSLSSLGTQSMGNPEINKMNEYAVEILKDTEKLAKLTDKDLIKQQKYSSVSNRLIDLKMDLMADEIDLLEEQNKLLTEMEKALEQSVGADKAKSAMRSFKLQRMTSLAAAPSAPGAAAPSAPGAAAPSAATSAAPAPSKPPAASTSNVVDSSGAPIMTGAGVPLTTTYGADSKSIAQDLNKLFDFGSASGSKDNFEQLEGGFKNAVIKAAEEYNATTGKKIRVNSAKRDSEDQERLYNAWVARGKTGMPVGRPGMSRHERGMAIDIQNYNDSQAVAALNRQGLFQKVPNDPVHFQFANGGISDGPKSGYLATLHGPEAIVPLPDGTSIPVKMDPNNSLNGTVDGLKSEVGNMMGQIRDLIVILSNNMNNGQLVDLMNEMVRAQKNSVDVQQKILASNY
jgi:LAS superfamily LD-carboxypeptidase LdcB